MTCIPTARLSMQGLLTTDFEADLEADFEADLEADFEADLEAGTETCAMVASDL